MQFIIFGDRRDPHIQDTLRSLRRPPGMADLSIILADFWPPEKTLSLTLAGAPGATPRPKLQIAGHPIDLSAPTLIWYRLKPPMPNDLRMFAQVSDHDYAYSQWLQLLVGLRPLFQHLRILNMNMASPQTPNSKAAQLVAAAKVGFAIPPTVIGNGLEQILGNLGRDILYKPFGSQAHESAHSAMAAKFNRETLSEHERNVLQAPAIYQDFVEKDHELRHHVFGRRSFMYKINSHLNERTEVDWRVEMDNPDIYSRLPSDDSVDALCRAYLDEVGLSFGTFDFIVDRAGRLVFLECNPDGQWYALASSTGADMPGALAEVIAEELAMLSGAADARAA